MKQFKETRIENKLWIVILFILGLFLVKMLTSCSAPANLLEPNKHDLVIIEIKGNHLQVVRACDVRTIILPGADTMKVGGILIAEE